MSYYYKYAFVSPEPVYSTVKEELKSYFDTGAVDDLLFPTYLDKALKKLGRTTYVITDEILFVQDFEARLPDNYRIREYVEAFLKFKVFETLTNQTNDETFNQLQQKLLYHKQAYEESFIMAMIEVKKQTGWEKQRRIKNDLNRFNMYELPTSRYGRRRN